MVVVHVVMLVLQIYKRKKRKVTICLLLALLELASSFERKSLIRRFSSIVAWFILISWYLFFLSKWFIVQKVRSWNKKGGAVVLVA